MARNFIKEFNLQNLSLEELRELSKQARAVYIQKTSVETFKDLAKFSLCDKVSFVSSRDQLVKTGVIEKLNQKTATVLVGNVHWRVSPCFLSKV